MITGEQMKKARIKIGKTQEQLADEMNMSQRKLSRFENNLNLQRYDEFVNLLLTLGLLKSNEENGEKELF